MGCSSGPFGSKIVLPFETQSIECIPFLIFRLQQTQVGLPFVANNLATGEASDRDNHFDILD